MVSICWSTAATDAGVAVATAGLVAETDVDVAVGVEETGGTVRIGVAVGYRGQGCYRERD